MATRPVTLNSAYTPAVPLATRRTLVRLLARAMTAAGVAADACVDVSLVDAATIHALNRQYADEDHATDVLSFSQHEGFVVAGQAALLGDIVIAVPVAAAQARAGKRPLVDELVHLAVHGLCHLLGYDHRTKAEERVMFGYETQLRDAARAPGTVAVVVNSSRTASRSRPSAARPTRARPRKAARAKTSTR